MGRFLQFQDQKSGKKERINERCCQLAIRLTPIILYGKKAFSLFLGVYCVEIDDLAEWMATQATNHTAFEWEANSKTDWQKEPEGWVTTRYEQKGKEAGRKQTYLIFRKKA